MGEGEQMWIIIIVPVLRDAPTVTTHFKLNRSLYIAALFMNTKTKNHGKKAFHIGERLNKPHYIFIASERRRKESIKHKSHKVLTAADGRRSKGCSAWFQHCSYTPLMSGAVTRRVPWRTGNSNQTGNWRTGKVTWRHLEAGGRAVWMVSHRGLYKLPGAMVMVKCNILNLPKSREHTQTRAHTHTTLT